MIERITQGAKLFESEAHRILGHCEASRSRVILVEQTYAELECLSLKQDELFRQAIRCLENGLHRPAHVMAWAAFMDYVEERLGDDNYVKLSQVRPKWTVRSAADLRESGPDSQIIDCLQLVGLSTYTEEKALKGLLNKRNESAHPSDYNPGLNETLGYISEIIERTKILETRHIK